MSSFSSNNGLSSLEWGLNASPWFNLRFCIRSTKTTLFSYFLGPRVLCLPTTFFIWWSVNIQCLYVIFLVHSLKLINKVNKTLRLNRSSQLFDGTLRTLLVMESCFRPILVHENLRYRKSILTRIWWIWTYDFNHLIKLTRDKETFSCNWYLSCCPITLS